MDPLSIAASVAGLIALSGSIYTIIGDFVERAAHPPQSAHVLLLSVSEMRIVFNSVSDLIENFLKYPPKRRALVQLDHLIICLTQAVLSFSELEKLVNPWVTRPHRSLWQRWKLINVEERISRINRRLQENKVSISLVLNILQCESDTDAQQYRISLQEMMERVIRENKELRTRVDELGSLLIDAAPSIATTFGRPGAAHTITESVAETDRIDFDNGLIVGEIESERSSVITRLSHRYSASLPVSVGAVLGLPAPFEDELAQSWVYARVRRTECDISFTSGLWSMLSGLSLGQISNISIIALPITLNDISNSSWYNGSARLQSGPLEIHLPPVSEGSSQLEMYYDIAVLGECEVGKSTLINMFCYGDPELSEKYSMLGLDYYTGAHVDGTECRLRITDTPGLGTSDYAVMVNEAIKHAKAFVLVYSVTDRNSFCKIQSLHDAIIQTKQVPPDECPPVVIVANKVDLNSSNVISPESSFSLAQELNCAIFECSFLQDSSISQPFIELVRRMLRSSPRWGGD
ncbi:P-loop containing nucleoside triphosphate hydrolase protein [Xylaria arbuscula]|nr:P-loop containing nucleoside triphosphate hydrolase protein [Xylaria arbuscula]